MSTSESDAAPVDDQVGVPGSPLRVAVIGAGPAGFYTVQHLYSHPGLQVEIDVFDRLPTPFGLVRSGVAPDHPKIKAVAALYHKLALNPGFRFFGNVEYGKDLTLDDLHHNYHQIVFAQGAQDDRRLNIPGEDLRGVHSAREFVAWYNGDPRHAHDEFNLDTEGAVVVGVGNVAADVARILCRAHDKLAATDIADYALDALDRSKVRRVWVLGRRGPVQSKISPPEVHELAELVETETSVPAADMRLDPYSQAELDSKLERDEVHRKFKALQELIDRKEPDKPRKLVLRFLVSPVEILGDEQGSVRAVRIVKNELYQDESGSIRPRPTDQYETIECGLVFRSVGYKGVAAPELPFDDRSGIIPNLQGRVFDPEGKQEVVGVYATGWIKRGPSGLIGSNKACAKETVERMLEDLEAGALGAPTAADSSEIEKTLDQRSVRYITYQDWMKIDAEEIQRGKALGRPRVKITELDQILAVLDR